MRHEEIQQVDLPGGCQKGLVTAHELNLTLLCQLQFANSTVNIRIGVHVFRTNRTLAVLVSLQLINTKYTVVTLTCVT